MVMFNGDRLMVVVGTDELGKPGHKLSISVIPMG